MPDRARAVLTTALFALAGCYASESPTDRDRDSCPADCDVADASRGVDGAASTDGPAPSDTSDPCDYVASLDRTCSTDADCASGEHYVNCCSQAYVGFRDTQLTTYAADEQACDATALQCNCNGSRRTDSGEEAVTASMVQVGCIGQPGGNVCMTYVSMRPADTR